MDDLDVQILRELNQASGVLPGRPGFRASYREIARAVSVSPGTARNRINRLYASGVLTGSSVYANPSVLGLEAGAYAVEVSHSHRKRDVINRLRALEGVYFIQNFRGTLVGVAFVYPDTVAREQTLESILGITGASGGFFSVVPYPPCHETLSPPEWKLVSRLVQGSFARYADLARELGVSVRTIKRRVSKLVRSHAVLCVATLDYRALSGCVPTDLIVAFSSPAARHEAERRILALVRDRMIFAGVWTDIGLYSLVLPKVSMASQIAEDVARIPGVGMSRVEIVEEHIDQVGSLRKYVDRKWAESLPTRARVPVPSSHSR
ncbi:MAG TPA: AsnC family transcriptional regulator [Thermoplasmata archaeon]|nr:AsnC family transcriptional regulator [Thermoplasmata archaeon]